MIILILLIFFIISLLALILNDWKTESEIIKELERAGVKVHISTVEDKYKITLSSYRADIVTHAEFIDKNREQALIRAEQYYKENQSAFTELSGYK